jgi:hypothetical protein
MKANELRIGNLVLSKGVPVQIEEIMWETVRHCFGEFPIDYVEPIPLTEKWLLKFGFYETTKEHYVSGLYTLNKPDGFYINKETMCYCDIDYEGTTNDRIKIQYVHQLQNLYFALTGEELTEGGDK